MLDNGPNVRMPPHNLEAEEGVLGSILLDNDVLPEVAATLRPDDFFRDGHAEIYRAILDLDSQGRAADAVTLCDELDRAGKLLDLGGIEFIASVVNGVPHAANARYYADIVKQKAVGRAVIEACDATLREAYSNQFTAEHLAAEFYRRAAEAAEGGTPDQARQVGGPLGDYLAHMDARRNGPVGIRSGLHELDALVEGWQDEMLYIIAGRPSTGKSSLALNAAAHAALNCNAPVLFFSLEMRSLELSERLFCADSGIPNYRIRDPNNLTDEELRVFGASFQKLRKAPLYVDDGPLHGVAQIAAVARKYQHIHGVRLVVIDYLQLIDMEDGTRSNRQEQVARTSRRLKVLARTLKCPILLLSQLNRQSEGREDKRPRMADLRESGSIEQDADVVILVHRPDRYDPNDSPGVVELIVDKNRNGATGTAKVGNQLDRFRLGDMAHHVIPAPAPDAPDVRAAAAGDF